MPDEYKPELTAPKRPMGTRKPYSLPAPMWDVPHDPDADAILALAVGGALPSPPLLSPAEARPTALLGAALCPLVS